MQLLRKWGHIAQSDLKPLASSHALPHPPKEHHCTQPDEVILFFQIFIFISPCLQYITLTFVERTWYVHTAHLDSFCVPRCSFKNMWITTSPLVLSGSFPLTSRPQVVVDLLLFTVLPFRTLRTQGVFTCVALAPGSLR